MAELLLAAGRILTAARTSAPGWLLLAGSRIVEVGEGRPPRSADVDLGDRTVVPGFVDIHVHGGGGSSFDGGDVEAASTVVGAHLAHGTTSMVASLVSDGSDALARALGSLAYLCDDGMLAGVHLEGPWLSPRQAGAHDPAHLAHPSSALVDRFVAAGGGHLRMVTLAPELPGGLDGVRRLVAAGVVVAIGHTDATYDQTRTALDAGATVGTHVFNAMRGLHHREPGPVAALLEHPGVFVELIADGVHVHPSLVGLVATSRPERIVLVTDAMAAAGAPDGAYRLGGLDVVVRDREARLAASGALAGSTLTLAAAVRYAVQVAGLPLPDAVRSATSAPAAALRLERVGDLRPGFAADLVVLDGDLAVERVMRRGAWVER